MMANTIVVLLICMLSAVVKSQAPSNQCPCNNPANIATWGNFIPSGSCEGSCHGIQRGTRSCFAIGPDATSIPRTTCQVERHCQNLESCEGNWSPWSAVGICTQNCKQTEARYCYRKGSTLNVRVKSCAGTVINGSIDERNTDCNHGNCNRNKPSSTILTSSPTTENKITTTEKKSERSGLTTSTNETSTKKNEVVSITVADGDPNDIIIKSVVGSVAVLSFTVIVITVACLVSRRKRPGTPYPSYANGTITSENTIQNDNYEQVGPVPPLPYRTTTAKGPSAPPPQSENIPNLLYQPMDANGLSQNGTRKAESASYLLPLPVADEYDPESIYSHIDENR